MSTPNLTHGKQNSISEAPHQLQTDAKPQFANVRLPDTAKPGDVVYAHAFGRQVRLEVPAQVTAEKMLQLQMLNGAITFAVAATMTVAAAASSASLPVASDVKTSVFASEDAK
jgi:hypothetical protein